MPPVPAAAFWLVLWLLPETKGRTLERALERGVLRQQMIIKSINPIDS